MPLDKSKSSAAFKRNVSTLMGEVGKSPHVKSEKQALAIAYSIKRRGKADGGAIERLPDHYAEIGAARIEDRRNHDPILRAMGIDKLKKRFGMKYSDAMMDSQRTEAEVVDRLVPRGHADGGAVLAPGFYAQGGSPYPQMWQPMAVGGTPWEVKAESRGMIPHSGYIPGSTGGRADTVPMGVKKGAYVVPADIVSALGDGNSQAGASKLGSMFGTAPYGAKTPRIRGTPLKTTRIIRQKFADGGPEMAESPVADIIASHGEFILSPEQLEARFGDINLGHDAMDKLVENVRKNYAKKLRKLPGPKGNGNHKENGGEVEPEVIPNFLSGQQYAMDYSKQRRQLEGVPRGGEPGGGLAAPAVRAVQQQSEDLTKVLRSGDRTLFPAEFEKLKTMPTEDLKALGREFIGRPMQSRQDALDKIWSRYQQLEQMRMKQEFMAGRSAG